MHKQFVCCGLLLTGTPFPWTKFKFDKGTVGGANPKFLIWVGMNCISLYQWLFFLHK